MMILTKAIQGQNKVYQLRDNAGAVDYVACTTDGQVWYVDLALAKKDAKDIRRRDVVFLTED